MIKPILPINKIGGENWVRKLTDFLQQYDVDVKPLATVESKVELPTHMTDYYKNFGGIESSDFMYNLYQPEKFIKLSESKWSFINENFTKEITTDFIVFSESPSNDPVCLNIKDFSVHFFSHDPVEHKKVFKDFNQYLIYEIIELQKLMGDFELTKDQEIEHQKIILGVENLDYNFRYIHFC